MKSLEELYGKIQNDEDLKQEFISSFKEGVIDDFLKNHECDASAEDVINYMNNLREGEISDDDLDHVAGGCRTSFTCNCKHTNQCFTLFCG